MALKTLLVLAPIKSGVVHIARVLQQVGLLDRLVEGLAVLNEAWLIGLNWARQIDLSTVFLNGVEDSVVVLLLTSLSLASLRKYCILLFRLVSEFALGKVADLSGWKTLVVVDWIAFAGNLLSGRAAFVVLEYRRIAFLVAGRKV